VSDEEFQRRWSANVKPLIRFGYRGWPARTAVIPGTTDPRSTVVRLKLELSVLLLVMARVGFIQGRCTITIARALMVDDRGEGKSSGYLEYLQNPSMSTTSLI